MNILSILLVFLGTMSAIANDERASLDGIYTESRTMLDQEGLETTVLMGDYAVLELQGDRFKFWHFSDRMSSRKFPITGKFLLKGESLELESDKLDASEKRHVVTTINEVAATSTRCRAILDRPNGRLSTSIVFDDQRNLGRRKMPAKKYLLRKARSLCQRSHCGNSSLVF